MKLNIIFVDDEPQLLASLKRLLHTHSREWDIRYATSGEEALDFMKSRMCDVLVTDIRMPQMDGATLLRKVRETYPKVVRIILSGYSDKELTMNTVHDAHQSLSKPASSEIIIKSLQQIQKVIERLPDENYRNIVSKIASVSALPSSYQDLVLEIQSEKATVASVASIISQDIGLTVSLLKLLNSSFFGLPGRITSIEYAVSLLGFEIIKGLALHHGYFLKFETSRYHGVLFNFLYDHSLNVASISRMIARLEGATQETTESSFTAGLTHDLGKVILADYFEKEYKEVLLMASKENIPFHVAESRLCSVSHDKVGAYLLGLWGFAPSVVDAVYYHHEPRNLLDNNLVLAATHAANVLEHDLVVVNQAYGPHGVNMDFLRAMNYENHYPIWLESAQETLIPSGNK